MERVAGIEPASSAWKAEVLPLNHTRIPTFPSALLNPQNFVIKTWWREKDSNLRRHSRQIYSLIPLTAREPHQNFCVPLDAYTRLKHSSNLRSNVLYNQLGPLAKLHRRSAGF